MAAKVIAWLARLGVAAIFLFAGVVKVWDFEKGASATPTFFESVMNYHLTGWDISMALAVFLPWLEIVTGGALLFQRWRPGALLLLAGQTTIFIGALTTAWWRKLDINCGCFGRENNTTDFRLRILEDFALLTVIGFLLWNEWRRANAAPVSAPGETSPSGANLGEDGPP